MDDNSGSDSNVASRATERASKWASSASSSVHGAQSQAVRDVPSGIPYGQGNFRPMNYGQDQNLLSQPIHPRSMVNVQGGGGYYDQSGYPQAVMANYDPTRMPRSSSVGSKSSTVEQSVSPVMGSYYSPSSVEAQQLQKSAYHTPFSSYRPLPSNVDASGTGYHIMRSMSGEMTGLPTDGQVHGPAIPSLNAATSHPEYGMNMNTGMYYQQYPSTQAGAYGQQTSFPVTVPTPGAGATYPTMLTGMQGYPLPQYASPAYGVYQTQYPMNAYPSHQQTPTGYYSNPRPAWPSAQSPSPSLPWRPNYYSHPSSTMTPSSMRRISRSNNTNNRSKGPNNSNLPVRPGGTAAAAAATSANLSSMANNLENSGMELDPSLEFEAKVPGKGLRPHYHPQQGPRSDHVLWCGNVPSDATVEELWSFFSLLPPESEGLNGEEDLQNQDQEQEQEESDPAMSLRSGHGVLSVFIIARSNCAFVNYASPKHLQRAVSYFHGQSLRPSDSRCPKLVCRVRKKDDEAQAGVAGQRGRGIHVAWVKEQDRKMKQKSRSISRTEDELSSTDPAAFKPEQNATEATPTGLTSTSSDSPDSTSLTNERANNPISQSGETTKAKDRPSISSTSIDSSSGSLSYTSTNSSLFRHPAFHERFFILKSLGTDDLDRSVQTGLWATQPHNEQVLDQAYRNSESVYLIFSANQSGGFYGYAKMIGTILSSREKQQLQTSSDGTASLSDSSGGGGPNRSSTVRPDAIPEVDEQMVDISTKGNNTLDVPPADSQSFPLVSPGGTGSNLNTTTSPLPLTPGTEMESPVPKLSPPENSSWPVAKQSKEANQSLPSIIRPQSTSNDTPLSKATAVPISTPIAPFPSLTTTAPAGIETSLQASPSNPLEPTLQSDEIYAAVPLVAVPMDENGVRRKDMVPGLASVSGSIGVLPTNSYDTGGSLGPSDSASHDSRSQHQLALRALIHNLRLEARESMMQAEDLENNMAKSASALHETSLSDAVKSNSPQRAGSSDSWGKPFKVEWIMTSTLPFGQVRKLRNPWRDNRQVKVSRDGTELEPNVGRQLLKEWERVDVIKVGEMLETTNDNKEDDEAD